MVGTMMNAGISLVILPKKDATVPYIPLACSLKNTPLSSGKRRITLWIPLNTMLRVKKNSAPCLFCMEILSSPSHPKISKIITDMIIPEMTLTYEANGILSKFLNALWTIKQYCLKMLALYSLKSLTSNKLVASGWTWSGSLLNSLVS